MQYGGLVDDGFLGDGLCHILYGQVCGDKSHAQRSVHKYHQRFLSFAQAVFDIFCVSGEVEEVALDIVFVDGRCHEHVVEFRPVVGHGLVESL